MMMTNKPPLLPFAALAIVVGLAPRSEAQSPYRARATTAVHSGSAARGLSPDPFRPYGTHRASRGPQPGFAYRSQGRATPPQAEVTRTNFYAQRHEYFPGLRSGQGPNRNVSYGRSHCAPSRTALLAR